MAEGGSVLATWQIVRQLYSGIDGVAESFERLQLLDPPPGPDETSDELQLIRRMQAHLVGDRLRQEEILRQADMDDLSDIYRPLGIDSGGYPDTEALIDAVMETAERVGYFYKQIFNRPRASELDPTLRTFIDVPAHAAYPSNHAFQMFSVAETFSRILPEHPGSAELFYVAQRVAENREYAGLHYPSDTRAGRQLARRFSPFMIKVLRREIGRALAEWR